MSAPQLGNPAGGDLPPRTSMICHLKTKAAGERGNVDTPQGFAAAIFSLACGKGTPTQSQRGRQENQSPGVTAVSLGQAT